MSNIYEINSSDDNLQLNVSVSKEMLVDLVRRSAENGRDIHIEIMMRLARSLERDLDMDEQDEMMNVIMNQNDE